MAALIREVFLQTPRLHEEAALALGATRWEMIKMAVIPFGRPGIISAMMLGLGRALGETMAVALVLSPARRSPIPTYRDGFDAFLHHHGHKSLRSLHH